MMMMRRSRRRRWRGCENVVMIMIIIGNDNFENTKEKK